jgi:hypothetical protein
MRMVQAAVIVCLGTGVVGVLYAQQGGARVTNQPSSLTPMDYIEIQQLVVRYSKALDSCSNNGYDYADLYASDGWFGSSREGVLVDKYQGRERLAQAAGGGSAKCAKLDRPGGLWTHVMANHLITPSAEGATGHVDLVYPLEQGAGFDNEHMGHVGHYEDVYVKTDYGWRFKSRTHVHPKTRGNARRGQAAQPGR